MIPQTVERRTAAEILCRRFPLQRLDPFVSAVARAFDLQSSDLGCLIEFEQPQAREHVGPKGPALLSEADPSPSENAACLSRIGLDYMLARYYSSGLARFMAVDPGDDTALEDPQSWNKYAYVSNNPLQYVDPDGTFKILGRNRHQNISRRATTQARHVNLRHVVRGNRRADSSRWYRSNDAAHINEGGPTGSASDSRIQQGADQLGAALRSLASGDTEAAGEALGASHHSFQDLVGHGGVTAEQHYSDANGGNVDSSDSPGFEDRVEGAEGLTSTINGIFNSAADAILAGGDLGAIVAGAQATAEQAATGAYGETKERLQSAGQVPEGY